MRILKRSVPKEIRKINLLFAKCSAVNKLRQLQLKSLRKTMMMFKLRTSNLQVHVCIESPVPLCFLWGVCSCVFSFVLLLPHVCQTTDRSGFLHLDEP
jgi:hypothetical protein